MPGVSVQEYIFNKRFMGFVGVCWDTRSADWPPVFVSLGCFLCVGRYLLCLFVYLVYVRSTYVVSYVGFTVVIVVMTIENSAF